MKTGLAGILIPLVIGGSLLAAGPALTGVVNPASNIPPGLPNYGIAQGSIFVVYGSGLGPATLAQPAALPLPTTAGLAGTSISITVNGVAVTAPMIYTVQGQAAAILPSNTPLGTGTLKLTFNGASGTIPITVVASNFGMSTVNQSGSGAGVITYPNYSLVTAVDSAKTGDTLVIWGTGLGPIPGSDAVIPAPADLGTPIQVFVGGVQATLLYRGRSASPGLDQINIAVPAGVSTGCNVSVVVQTGSLVSNTTSIPVASGGGTCSDATPGSTPTPPVNAGSYKYGFLSLGNVSETVTLNGQLSTTAQTSADAIFEQITIAQGATGGTTGSTGTSTTTASFGSCSVTSSLTSLSGGSGGSGSTGSTGVTEKGLDAGPSISILPPSGSAFAVPSQGIGLYLASPPNLAALPAGAYQFSNGSGGADVGPFSVTAILGAPLIWTNSSIANAAIDRTKPFTVLWTGGGSGGTVEIILTTEAIDTKALTGASATVSCSAPVSAGQFTVPSYVLLSLIPNATVSLVELEEFSSQTVKIPGIDIGSVSTSSVAAVGTAATTFK